MLKNEGQKNEEERKETIQDRQARMIVERLKDMKIIPILDITAVILGVIGLILCISALV